MDDQANGKPTESAPKLNADGKGIVIALRHAVIANGEETKELTFREPTAADIERYGNPVIFDPFVDPPKMSFDSKAMTMMMSALATVPPSTIRQLHTKDWNNAAWQLAGFFTPDL